MRRREDSCYSLRSCKLPKERFAFRNFQKAYFAHARFQPRGSNKKNRGQNRIELLDKYPHYASEEGREVFLMREKQTADKIPSTTATAIRSSPNPPMRPPPLAALAALAWIVA